MYKAFLANPEQFTIYLCIYLVLPICVSIYLGLLMAWVVTGGRMSEALLANLEQFTNHIYMYVSIYLGLLKANVVTGANIIIQIGASNNNHTAVCIALATQTLIGSEQLKL